MTLLVEIEEESDGRWIAAILDMRMLPQRRFIDAVSRVTAL